MEFHILLRQKPVPRGEASQAGPPLRPWSRGQASASTRGRRRSPWAKSSDDRGRSPRTSRRVSAAAESLGDIAVR